MSDVASLDLCRELYELADWNEVHWWYKTWDGIDWQLGTYEADIPECIPAYDLGYLLRKLPQNIGRITLKHREHSGMWFCKWDDRKGELGQQADTPEDAAAKLAIELFKQGILMREDGQELGGGDA
jgi:hypothetical protein